MCSIKENSFFFMKETKSLSTIKKNQSYFKLWLNLFIENALSSLTERKFTKLLGMELYRHKQIKIYYRKF